MQPPKLHLKCMTHVCSLIKGYYDKNTSY
jgi:hypothetical protein